MVPAVCARARRRLRSLVVRQFRVFKRKYRLFNQKCPGLTGSLEREVAMATERQREIKRRRKRREKRLKARTREARKHKKKR